jgi:hypothetical protein
MTSLRSVYQKPLDDDDQADFTPPLLREGQQRRSDEDGRLIRKALLQNFVFASLPDRELDEMCQAFEDCSYSKGETIIDADNPGEHFYIIQSGTVQVLVDGVAVSQATSGDTFGELSLVYAVRLCRACSVRIAQVAVLRAPSPSHMVALSLPLTFQRHKRLLVP